MFDSHKSLWDDISRCYVCMNDERIEPEVRDRWRTGVFLPLPSVGPEPAGLPVGYLLVAQEPSASWTGGNREAARQKIANGMKNFNTSGGDFAIRWAAHNWLVNKGQEAFLLTDLAKCSVASKDAFDTMPRRYRNCRCFLNREVELHRLTLRAIIPVGKEAYRWCIAAAEPNWPPITQAVTHYAWRFPRPETQGADRVGLPTEAEFAEFVKQCNPTSSGRLHERDRRILNVYRREFAEIKAQFGSGHQTTATERPHPLPTALPVISGPRELS